MSRGKWKYVNMPPPYDALLLRNKVEEVFNMRIGTEWWRTPNRRQEIVWARQALMYLLRFYCRMNVVEIGLYCNRDHSTVVHACATVADWQRQVSMKDLRRMLKQCEEYAERITGASPASDETDLPQHRQPSNWPREKINQAEGYL
jgi:hypothetical protein